MGPVPSSYYVRQHVKVDYEQCMVVKRGSTQQLDYEILFPGCVLRSDTLHNLPTIIMIAIIMSIELIVLLYPIYIEKKSDKKNKAPQIQKKQKSSFFKHSSKKNFCSFPRKFIVFNDNK